MQSFKGRGAPVRRPNREVSVFGETDRANGSCALRRKTIGRGRRPGGIQKMNEEQEATIDKKRILVVDDQAQNTQLLKAYLERHNYVVKEENNPRAALSSAELFKPDLILLDVMMPGMDGGELAARFKAHAKLKTVPTVFLTASVTKAEVNAAGGLIGGDRFLAKPLVLTDVLACLKECLG